MQIGKDDFQRYERNLRSVSLWRRPSTHTVSNSLATSRKTVPVSIFLQSCLELFQRGGLVVVPCCVWIRTQTAHCGGTRASLLRLGSWWVGSSQTACQSCLADVVRNEVSPGSFQGFRVEVTRQYFHAGGKYCVRKITFTNLTRKDTAISGGCFRAIFGLTFGPGVWLTDRRYTGSHSPHCYDVLLSPANHRAASQVVASHKWRGFPSA